MFSKLSKFAAATTNHLASKSLRVDIRSAQLISSCSTQKQSNALKTDEKLSAIHLCTMPFAPDLTSQLRRECDSLMTVFPEVVHDLTTMAAKYDTDIAASHLARALEYNVPHGKKLRGLAAVFAYKNLVDQSELTPENIRLAHLLAWCIEILQSVFLITDDMVDCSEIRRNKACWYKVDDVKSLAVNDAVMIENCLYYLLKKHFGHLKCYPNLFELFHESTMATMIGQSLDFHSAKNGVDHFTMTLHRTISDHKTAHFAFYAPIALPMLLAGYTNPNVFRQTKAIYFEMGHFYQVQNDFLDCFADPEVLKKPGSDIEEGKCTWLAVKCMENGTELQKQILRECCGKNDIDSVSQVKQVYQDMDLPEEYRRYEDETYEMIKMKIQRSSHDVPHNILYEALNRLFNRI